jgi:hypothetical protein
VPTCQIEDPSLNCSPAEIWPPPSGLPFTWTKDPDAVLKYNLFWLQRKLTWRSTTAGSLRPDKEPSAISAEPIR